MRATTYISMSNMSVINPYESNGATFIPIKNMSVNIMQFTEKQYCLACNQGWEVKDKKVLHFPFGFYDKPLYKSCPDCEMDISKHIYALEDYIVEIFEKDLLDVTIFQMLLRRIVSIKLAIHLGDNA